MKVAELAERVKQDLPHLVRYAEQAAALAVDGNVWESKRAGWQVLVGARQYAVVAGKIGTRCSCGHPWTCLHRTAVAAMQIVVAEG